MPGLSEADRRPETPLAELAVNHDLVGSARAREIVDVRPLLHDGLAGVNAHFHRQGFLSAERQLQREMILLRVRLLASGQLERVDIARDANGDFRTILQ